MPERFLFIELSNLKPIFEMCPGREVDLIFLFRSAHSRLTGAVKASNFALFCSPAVNLFSQKANRIRLTPGRARYHIVPDGGRPFDFEVHGVSEAFGYGDRAEPEMKFLPYHELNDRRYYRGREGYYTLIREPDQPSGQDWDYRGDRPRYTANEVYASLVDGRKNPFGGKLKELDLTLVCTNRDLPLRMPVGSGDTDLTLQTGPAVESIRCLVGPTPPRSCIALGKKAWPLISHLSLNYLSLRDTDAETGAAALREILSIYADFGERVMKKQIEGLLSISSEPTLAPFYFTGTVPAPPTFQWGLKITITVDEKAFEGYGPFVFGAVLEQFLPHYVSELSFTEMVLATNERGVIMRWPLRTGRRPLV